MRNFSAEWIKIRIIFYFFGASEFCVGKVKRYRDEGGGFTGGAGLQPAYSPRSRSSPDDQPASLPLDTWPGKFELCMKLGD